MSKSRLLLINCSNGIRLGGKPRHHGHSFRPLVIHGGARAKSVPRVSAWEAALELMDLSFSISNKNYRALLHASITILDAYNQTHPEKDQLNSHRAPDSRPRSHAILSPLQPPYAPRR